MTEPAPRLPYETTVVLDPTTRSVTLAGLTVRSADLHDHLLAMPGDAERSAFARDALVLGFEVLRRAEAQREVEFVERRLDRMTARFDEKLRELETRFRQAIDESFDLGKDTSAAKQMVDRFERLVGAARQEISRAQQEVEGRLASTFDAEGGGRLGLLLRQIADFDGKVRALFDPQNRTSFLGQMHDRMSDVFDPQKGSLNRLLDTRLGFDQEGSPFRRFRDDLLGELGRLRTEIEGYRGQLLGEVKVEEERERGTQKGFTFEDEVEAALGTIAKTLGDEVERVSMVADPTGSKKGDFVVTFSDTGGRLVIDAKDEPMRSLPDTKRVLEGAMGARNAVYALLLRRDPEQLQTQVGLFNEYEKKMLVTSFPHLEIAIKWARLRTRVLKDAAEGLDVDSLLSDLERVEAALRCVAEMRRQLTAVGQAKERIEALVRDLEDAVKAAIALARARVREGGAGGRDA